MNSILSNIDREIDRLQKLRAIFENATHALHAFDFSTPYPLSNLSLLQTHNEGNVGDARELAKAVGANWKKESDRSKWRGVITIPGHEPVDFIIHNADKAVAVENPEAVEL